MQSQPDLAREMLEFGSMYTPTSIAGVPYALALLMGLAADTLITRVLQ